MATRPKIQKSWKTDLLDKSKKNPDWWIENVLGDTVWSKQKEICRAVVEHERVAVPAAFSVGKCSGWNELIDLADGSRVESHKLIGREFNVLAFDEKTGRQVSAPAFAEDNGIKAVYKIVTKSGREIIRTGNHPLYSCRITRRNTTIYPEDIAWRRIDELDVTHHAVAVPLKLDVNAKECPISDDEIKLLGYLLGDGGLRGGVTFTQKESRTKNEFREIIDRLGCRCVDHDRLTIRVTGKDYKAASQNHNNYVLNLVREWSIYNKKAVDKSFPDFVWKFSDRQLALLLNRLWSCDGWVCASRTTGHQIAITFASEKMTRDVQHALIRLGIYGFFSSGENTRQVEGKTFYAYTWSIKRGRYIIEFYNKIGVFGKEEKLQQAYDMAVSRLHQRERIQWIYRDLTENYIWEKIKKIEYVGYQRTVGICVPQYHTYLTEFVEHNTWLAARIALWFLYNHSPCRVLTTAPTGRQVRDLLWAELRTAHRKSKVKLGGEPLTLKLNLSTSRFAVGFSTEENNIDMFTGYHASNQLIIFDQAGGLPKMFWDATEGLMTSANCRWLAISNTAIADGDFADICMPERTSKHGTWKIVPIKATESPNVVAGRNVFPGLIPYDWVEKRKEQWGEQDPMYRIFVEAEFVPTVEMTVIPYNLLVDSYARIGDADEDEIEVGLDVARSGLDSTVWFARCGERALELKRVNGNDTMQVAGETIEFMRKLERKYEKPVRVIKIDVIGVGAGVYDRLAEQDLPVLPINNAEVKIVADKERFSNVRAEMAWAFRDRFESGRVGLKNLKRFGEMFDSLQGDLQVIKYKITSSGKIQIQSKDEIKKKLGRSPDFWDAAVMAYEEPGGGPAMVEFMSTVDQKLIPDEDWLTLIGENVSIDDPSFVELERY